jgi:glycosyltransferase involved in cell wall biosynthesis
LPTLDTGGVLCATPEFSAMTENPLISVVIPAYNCAQYIEAALDSVVSQSYNRMEIIVVNDGSTDDTARKVETYPGVKCIHQPNGGLPNARNTGIRASRGDYIALLDGDDIWPVNKLWEQMEFIAAHPECGLLFGNARRFSDDGWTEPPLFERYALNREFFGHDYLVIDPLSKLLAMNFIPVGTVVVRKDWLYQANLFDESLRRVEDWDIWLRVALHHPMAYSPKVWKLKRVHSTNLSNDTEAMAKTALYVLEKFKSAHADELARHGVNVSPHLGKGYRNLGYFYLQQRRLQEGRQMLARSLTCGFDPRAVLYWISTFLNPGLVGALMRIRG